MRNRIIWKLFWSFVLLIVTAVLVLSFFVGLAIQNDFERKMSDKLRSNATLVGEMLKSDLQNPQEGIIQEASKRWARELNLRITVVDRQGKVLGDSAQDPAMMENHKDRPEVAAALRSGFGQSRRFSKTLACNMKYVAVEVTHGSEILGVVRFALPLSEVQMEMRLIYGAMLLGGTAAIIVALIIAYFISRTISSPIKEMQRTAERIAKGDFTKTITIKSTDELGELAKSLNRMADELQRKIETLKRLDTIKTDFVANVSHELKTPLTSIKGFVETLEGGAINDEQNAMRFLSIIRKHTDRLGKIIDDLLSLSDLELRKDSIEKGEVDLKSLVDEVVMGFGHALATKRQNLIVHSQQGDFRIKADRDRIEQVFVNLLDNAIKYTKEGGHIAVSLSPGEDGVTVVVEDNGIGIPREHLDRVFERFYRVDKARSRQLGGTGLGLAIAKHIILLHNGKISIESEPGRGTKVFVALPRE